MRHYLTAVTVAFLLAAGPGTSSATAPLPPRSAGDIVALLRAAPQNTEAQKSARALLDAPEPAGAPGPELALAWMQRGRAAETLGLTDRYLAAYRKAWEASGGPIDQSQAMLRVEYTAAEIHAGNMFAAIRIQEELALRAPLPGPRLQANAFLAETMARFGDIDAATTKLAAAEADFSTLQRSQFWGIWGYAWEAAVERARGAVALARGKFGEAESHFRKSADLRERDLERNQFRLDTKRETFSQPIAIGFMLVAQKALADALLQQGRLVEAEVLYRDIVARGVREFGTGSPLMQLHLEGLANVLLEQGRARDALELAGTTLEILTQQGAAAESRMLLLTRSRVAAAHVALEDWPAARRQYDAIATVLDRDQELKQRIGRGSKGWAMTLIRTGEPAAATAMMERLVAADTRRFAEDDPQLAQTRGFLAIAQAASGRTAEALGNFRTAMPILLRAQQDMPDEGPTAAARRLVMIVEAYLDLLARLQREGSIPAGLDVVAESFSAADVARASSVQRALLASAARAAVRDPRLAQLARAEQDLSHRIATLTDTLSRLASVPQEQRLEKVIADIRRDIPLLKEERKKLRASIQADFPDYADLTNPRPLAPADVQAILAADEAMIAFYVGSRQTYAWAIPRQGTPQFIAVDLPRATLRDNIARLRSQLDPGEGIGLDLDFDVALANSLYERLVRPLSKTIGSAGHLLVVSHGELGQIPFSLLLTRPEKPAKGAIPFEGYARLPWLIRDHALTQLPSAATLSALRRPAPTTTAVRLPFLGFGDPVFNNAPQSAAASTRGLKLRHSANTRSASSAMLEDLPPLPDTADELREMALALKVDGESAVRLGRAASETAVKQTNLTGYRVIAFATHGLKPGDLNGLTQPALALSNPSGTGEADADGLLTMEEILGLRMNADWVVLSACNTASGDGHSAEAVSGLGRAFFYAGSRALLATNWPVETVSARVLTTELFRLQAAQPDLGRAQALRAAMLATMERKASDVQGGKARFSYAHPLFWAPYSLIGDGGK